MRALLRDRSYRRLLVGQTLSAFGDHAMFLALAVWVKALTGSNAKAGLAILPFVLPSLFGPALGVYVDRFPRRRVMVADRPRRGPRAAPAAGGTRRERHLADLRRVVPARASRTVVYGAARAGLLVSMVPGEDLGDANGLLQSTNQAMRLLAPLVGREPVRGRSAGRRSRCSTRAPSSCRRCSCSASRRRRSSARRRTTSGPSCAQALRHIVHTTDVRRLTVATIFVTLGGGRHGGRDLRADRRGPAPRARVPRRAVHRARASGPSSAASWSARRSAGSASCRRSPGR